MQCVLNVEQHASTHTRNVRLTISDCLVRSAHARARAQTREVDERREKKNVEFIERFEYLAYNDV